MNSIQNLEHSRSDQAETIITKTTCPYCGVGCGVDVSVQHKTHGTTVQVAGDMNHPSNFGRLCIKGSNLADTLGLETRVLHPMFGRKNHRQVKTWDQAIEKIADQFQACIDQYGADSVAFYVSGQLLTEDYYVVNKFVKGYLGTANIDTNSRLCMSSAVAAHKRAFGEDIVPASYEDFEHTGVIPCCINGLCKQRARIQICLWWWSTLVLPVPASRQIYIYRFYLVRMWLYSMACFSIFTIMITPTIIL